MAWDPEQYLKFAQPRLRPALDLFARIAIDAPSSVFDLGCGTGQITRLMAERWPRSSITGLDDSPDMLGRADAALPNIVWQRQDLAHWSAPSPCDLIYSNATLHWLPDHARLFTHLVGQLRPQGVLAVQMPRNFLAPSHTAIAQTALEGPWRSVLEPLLAPPPVAEPAWYYDLLAPLSSQLDIWETEYLQVLEGPDPVKEWTKGTWLKTFLDALEEPMRGHFEQAYAQRVAQAYPVRADGKTLFPFRRLFMILRR